MKSIKTARALKMQPTSTGLFCKNSFMASNIKTISYSHMGKLKPSWFLHIRSCGIFIDLTTM
jgi:hypothetical protein